MGSTKEIEERCSRQPWRISKVRGLTEVGLPSLALMDKPSWLEVPGPKRVRVPDLETRNRDPTEDLVD